MNDVLRHQLMALRAQIDSMLLADQQEREAEERRVIELDGRCAHPMEERVSTARMGHPDAFICKVCGQEVEGRASPVAVEA